MKIVGGNLSWRKPKSGPRRVRESLYLDLKHTLSRLAVDLRKWARREPDGAVHEAQHRYASECVDLEHMLDSSPEVE